VQNRRAFYALSGLFDSPVSIGLFSVHCRFERGGSRPTEPSPTAQPGSTYLGVGVQSVQIVPISLLCKINDLYGYKINLSNEINTSLRF
jgi:hypothetical protein